MKKENPVWMAHMTQYPPSKKPHYGSISDEHQLSLGWVPPWFPPTCPIFQPNICTYLPILCSLLPSHPLNFLPTYPSTSYLPTLQPTYPHFFSIHCLHHQAFQFHSTPLGWSSHGGLCSKLKLFLMPWSSCMQLGCCGAWRSSLTPWTQSWRSKISLPSLSFPGLVSLKFCRV